MLDRVHQDETLAEEVLEEEVHVHVRYGGERADDLHPPEVSKHSSCRNGSSGNRLEERDDVEVRKADLRDNRLRRKRSSAWEHQGWAEPPITSVQVHRTAWGHQKCLPSFRPNWSSADEVHAGLWLSSPAQLATEGQTTEGQATKGQYESQHSSEVLHQEKA